MNIEKVIISLYLKNENVLRVKLSPVVIFFSFIIVTSGLFASLFFNFRNTELTPKIVNEEKVLDAIIKEKVVAVPKVILKKRKVITKTSRLKDVVQVVQKVESAVKKDQLVKVLWPKIDMIDGPASFSFFISKVDKSNPEKIRGMVSAILIDEDGNEVEDTFRNERFGLKNARKTVFSFTSINEKQKVRINVNVGDNLVHTETLELKKL